MNAATQNIFKKYIFPAILAALVYFPLFYNLDRLPLMQFDEARVAMSSYEMSENNNFLVVHYDGKPEMWSTKPPITNWAQVFFIKTLGLNILSVRLPSALAGFFTCILLWLFSVRYLKNRWIGFISVIVLVTSQGYIQRHVIRTADYDAMLVFFTTASSILYFLFLDTNNFKYLRWFCLALALGVLTKAIAGLLLLPGLFVFTLFYYKKLAFFAKKKTYIALLYFFIPVLGYYLLREAFNPGYIQAAWYWDVAGRFNEHLTGEEPYFGYYIHLMRTEHFTHWFWISIAGIPLGLLIKDKRINKGILFTACCALGFLVVVSKASTQMLWYEAPIYPFVALLAAAAIYWAVDVLKALVSNLHFNILPYFLVVWLCFIPYKDSFNSVSPPKFNNNWEDEAQALNFYLKNAYQTNRNLNGYSWVDDDWYNPYIYFQIKMFEKNKGQTITQKHLDSLNKGDTVIGFLNNIKPKIEAQYQTQVIEEFEKYLKVYKIEGRKETADTMLSSTQSQ